MASAYCYFHCPDCHAISRAWFETPEGKAWTGADPFPDLPDCGQDHALEWTPACNDDDSCLGCIADWPELEAGVRDPGLLNRLGFDLGEAVDILLPDLEL